MPRQIPCPACQGTGHMSADRADELSAMYRQPVCALYGCEECSGDGTVEADDCDDLVMEAA